MDEKPIETHTLTGHGDLTFEHHPTGVVIREDDGLGNESGVFLPYDRADQVIAILQRRPATSPAALRPARGPARDRTPPKEINDR